MFLAPETDPFWRFLAPEISKKDQFQAPEIAEKDWRTYIHYTVIYNAILFNSKLNNVMYALSNLLGSGLV